MKPVKFPEANTEFATGQPEYIPLPAHVDFADPSSRTTFCWQLSWRDRVRILLTGKVWHQVLKFSGPLQPQKLSSEKPAL